MDPEPQEAKLSVIPSAKVPSDVKKERVVVVRELCSLKNFLTTPNSYQGDNFLGIKMHPFLDRKSSCTCYHKATFQ